ncbi:cytochrome P450 [Allopontixanthobacter sp.]|uniref:cytochrome P450 n=1 Tax=Allopontixanthobacter sp. TaxID=2906452 RepID=UPI002ABB6FA0|nr:cytochrome P450 [Allopontixanthobacter sp.]MDZ4306501.1 cytochrome P450 [Allopontixanthobacter sp.]
MATNPADVSGPQGAAAPIYRTSPTAVEALEAHLAQHPEDLPVHTQDWDVSRSDLYVEDRWQPIFAEMRAKAPINKITGSPFGDYWNVTTHKLIQHVESLPDIFSSSWKNGGITILDRKDDLVEDQRFELPMFIAMDRPEHTGQRRTVAPAFTPAEMTRLSDDLRARTGEVLDALPYGETFDWVEKVSIELTTQMLAILFDFPWKDRHLLSFWSDWAGDTEVALIPGLDEVRHSMLMEMAAYFTGLWQERANAGEAPDLISRMIHSDAMNAMSPQEYMGNLVLLIVGGNDTTRNTMSGIVHSMDKFPDQRALFESDASIIPNAVQECIRFQTPLAHMRRTATEDTDLFGHEIKAGEKVILWYISANRDEAVFDNPDALDFTRENARRHLAFGYGIHRCVGARLAELQLRILLEEMHARRMRVNVVGVVERVRANFVHGFRKLEVRLEKF